MRPSTRWLLPLIVLAFGAIAPAAHAVTVVTYNGTQGLTVTGDDAANGISIGPSGSSGYQVFISNGSAFSGGGCSQGSPTGTGSIPFDCPVTGVRVVSVTAAGENDSVGIIVPAGDAVTVNLGDGNDNFGAVQSVGKVTVDGGNGNDDLQGSQGDDVLRGGPGRDSFFGHKGVDVMQGGDDDDSFHASARTNPAGVFTVPEPETTPQPDVMDGGPGVDTVDYIFTEESVSVSLDGGSNDGRVGENDNVINMENVVGGARANTITGNGLANRLSVSLIGSSNGPSSGDDVFHGGDGDDVIGGGAGNDQIFGEGGADTIFGGANSDTIDGGGGIDILRDEFQPGNQGGADAGNDPSTTSGSVQTPGDDSLDGGPGDDFLLTGGGVDTSHGGDGADTIRAFAPTSGAIAEVAFGDDQNDDIVGSGIMRVEGNDGDDKLSIGGFPQQAAIIGGIGNDRIQNFSGSGNDTIDGGSGADIIESGQGDDQVSGGTGDDTIGNLVASGSSAGSDTIFGGPGADTINTRQSPPNANAASPDTVDCGRNLPRRDDDGDSLEKNLVDTAKDCENVTDSPYGERVNVSVPEQTLSIPSRGRVEVEVKCLRKVATGKGCNGTTRLGTLSLSGNAGPLGGKQHFHIDRGDSKTLLVPIRDADRAKLRHKANERARIEIVQPGDKDIHTTIRALQAKKE